MTSAVRILVIVAISSAAGAVQKAITGHPWIPDRARVEESQAKKGELQKRHAELREKAGVLLDAFLRGAAEGSLVLDARPAEEFEKGHLANYGPIPVLNVEPAPEKFPPNLDRLMQFQGTPILIYCTSDTCELGEELYLELEKNGFYDMKIYFPGWEGLTKAAAKTVTGPDRWTAADSLALMGQSNATPPAPDDASDPTSADPSAEQP